MVRLLGQPQCPRARAIGPCMHGSVLDHGGTRCTRTQHMSLYHTREVRGYDSADCCSVLCRCTPYRLGTCTYEYVVQFRMYLPTPRLATEYRFRPHGSDLNWVWLAGKSKPIRWPLWYCGNSTFDDKPRDEAWCDGFCATMRSRFGCPHSTPYNRCHMNRIRMAIIRKVFDVRDIMTINYSSWCFCLRTSFGSRWKRQTVTILSAYIKMRTD